MESFRTDKQQEHVVTLWLHDDGMLPNNAQLPVLIYPGALAEAPQEIEARFNRNGWGNSWQNGVFNYHHYHSNCHEVLGVIRGSAALQLGGDSGETLHVGAGDVLVLPAGTAHKRLHSSADFSVAGAYPAGMDYNLRRDNAADRVEALKEIPGVPLPATDPVYGGDGPLRAHWQAANSRGEG
ncbi:hypothetical protein B9T62_30045 [Paenibacillus donghaensis]|uniref:Cupin type-2 domain-containing protein n=2 Tax=Paenibacillus donghaensis TaxID=414771 RepID=A0A2Z2KKH4_9BACL|nr:hypothetical protein B9T62_30045 [Paenibacillus donghaensis]